MAATEVSILFTDRGGTDTLDNHRTYSRMYEVITDDPADDEQIVGNADVGGVAVPLPGDPLDSDPEAVCTELEFRQSDDSDTIWYVTVTYDSDPHTAERDRPDNKVDLDGNAIPKGERQANPLNEPATWSLTFRDKEEPADTGIAVGYDGNLVTISPALWAAGTTYAPETLVVNGTNVYVSIAANGVSGATGPTGTGTNITDAPAAWVATTGYVAGNVRKNGASVYECTSAGTSAGSGGPVGQGEAIIDGTAIWKYRGVPAAWNYLAPASSIANNPRFAPLVAIANTAGLPFDPPPMVATSYVVLAVTKNMPFTSVEYLLALKNAVNWFPWRGVPNRCAKVLNVSSDGGKEQNGIQYTTGKWEIELSPDTHDLRVLDAGTGAFVNADNGAGGTVRIFEPFTSGRGAELGVFPMNGAGGMLAPEQKPVYLRFVPRQTRLLDFNQWLPF